MLISDCERKKKLSSRRYDTRYFSLSFFNLFSELKGSKCMKRGGWEEIKKENNTFSPMDHSLFYHSRHTVSSQPWIWSAVVPSFCLNYKCFTSLSWVHTKGFRGKKKKWNMNSKGSSFLWDTAKCAE